MNIISETLEPPPSSLTYSPQLDGIRAFAVLLVLVHHWCPPPRFGPGIIGVWIFFVLSGFLITRILFTSRRATAKANWRALSKFYVRRFLRIFPLYYFVLVLAFAFSAVFRDDWYWYAAYLQNFRMIFNNGQTYFFGTHLWSLAVEEQFYVVWPLIALFAPRFVLLPIILLAIVAASATRYYCAQLGWNPFQVYIFTPSNLDTLGFGALLAYVVTYWPRYVVLVRRIALAAGIAIVVGMIAFRIRTGYSGIIPLPTGLISLWMIASAADGFRGLPGMILSFPVSVYIGRISYGIYVYHYFVPDILKPLFEQLHIERPSVPFVIICFLVTMVICSLSWFLYEKPINSLKDRFTSSSRPTKIITHTS